MSEMDRSIVTAFVTSGRFLASAVKLSKHPHIHRRNKKCTKRRRGTVFRIVTDVYKET